MQRVLVRLLLLTLLLPYAQLMQVYWSSGQSYAMASLIALFGAGLITWQRRSELVTMTRQGVTPRTARIGYICLALAVFLYVLSWTVLMRRAAVGVSVLGIAVSACFATLGWRGIRLLALPLLLMAISIPMPGAVVALTNYYLVSIASFSGAEVLSWFVEGVHREGAVIAIAGHGGVEVVEDCSGLEGALLFLPLALLVVYFRPGLPRSAAVMVVALAVPLALLGNLLRIVSTGLFEAMDVRLNQAAWFHEVLGFTCLGLVLAMLLALPGWLDRWSTRSDRPLEEGVLDA